MPEWLQAALTVTGAMIGSYLAIRVELRWIRRDVDELRARVASIERDGSPRRRWNDPRPVRVRSD